METTPTILNRVKKKILSMHKQLHAVEAENQKLREGMLSRKEISNKQEERISVLQNELETLKLAKSLGTEGVADKGAKNKINEMVKEIDRCIALLND
jgi:hypothetical protein